MLGRVMKGSTTTVRLIAGLCTVGVLSGGCVSMRELAGFAPQGDPSVALRPSEPKWLLIKNPRFGEVASEPEYIWVEEDKVPTTMKSLIFGKSSMIAPPEIVAKYGTPPGGGRISPRQGGAYKLENLAPLADASRSSVAAASTSTRTDAVRGPAPGGGKRGYVVFVDTSRVVIDLAATDGVRLGSTVSLRRDKVAIVHPITGELLGELDEEVASGKVVEIQDKFSVVELQSLPSGAQVKVKDRVVVR
jgi:hypothetical protein